MMQTGAFVGTSLVRMCPNNLFLATKFETQMQSFTKRLKLAEPRFGFGSAQNVGENLGFLY
jgi:hypothetical protein